MGEKTLNEYFYKPSYGASGTVEKGKFDDALDVADAQIEANKTVTPSFDTVQFNVEYSDGHAIGRLQWNDTDGTLEIGMKGGSVNLQVGQEFFTRVVNKTGTQIDDGKPVYVNGMLGNRPTIALAKADSRATMDTLIGLTTENIADNAEGYITLFGLVRDVDTDSWTVGDFLYVSPDTAGLLVTTRPTSPNIVGAIGSVFTKHATQGIIGVKVTVVPQLIQLSDTPANYTDAANKFLQVNAGADGVIFDTIQKADISDLNNVENLKVKLDGTSAPTVNNDVDEGYTVGSRWFDVTNDKEYVCLDNTDGAAVWTETTQSGGGGAFTDLTDTPANFTNSAGKTLKVNSTPDAVEFANDTNITTKTTTATLTVAEQGTIFVSAASAYTITLPTAVGNAGLTYHFKKTDFNYNLITLDGNGTETLNYENSTSAPCLTYLRLNTGGAEVTVVSDNSNWQVLSETLGQVPMALVYPSADQLNLTASTTLYVENDTEVYDIGNNYDISIWVSGNATSTSAGHLVDSGGAFTADMVKKRVKNTTDTTYTYVTAYNSATDLTVRDNIFINGEGYEIKNSKFVCPVAGKYFISAKVEFKATTVIADKTYLVALYKNGTSNFLVYEQASGTQALDCSGSKLLEFAKDDEVAMVAMSGAAVNTVDIQGTGDKWTFFQIQLISKD